MSIKQRFQVDTRNGKRVGIIIHSIVKDGLIIEKEIKVFGGKPNPKPKIIEKSLIVIPNDQIVKKEKKRKKEKIQNKQLKKIQNSNTKIKWGNF